jgi:hypothetical protein
LRIVSLTFFSFDFPDACCCLYFLVAAAREHSGLLTVSPVWREPDGYEIRGSANAIFRYLRLHPDPQLRNLVQETDAIHTGSMYRVDLRRRSPEIDSAVDTFCDWYGFGCPLLRGCSSDSLFPPHLTNAGRPQIFDQACSSVVSLRLIPASLTLRASWTEMRSLLRRRRSRKNWATLSPGWRRAQRPARSFAATA